jgi:hypothetical protein
MSLRDVIVEIVPWLESVCDPFAYQDGYPGGEGQLRAEEADGACGFCVKHQIQTSVNSSLFTLIKPEKRNFNSNFLL